MNASKTSMPIPNIIALCAAMVGLAMLVFGGYNVAKSTAAQRWPTTAGTVLDARVVDVDMGGSHGTYGPNGTHIVKRAEVRYRYEANGKVFESENLSFRTAQIGGTRRFFPPELVSQYPVGAAIRVSYDPADPASAVADPSCSSYVYLIPIAGILLLVGGLFYLVTHPIKTSNAGQ